MNRRRMKEIQNKRRLKKQIFIRECHETMFNKAEGSLNGGHSPGLRTRFRLPEISRRWTSLKIQGRSYRPYSCRSKSVASRFLVYGLCLLLLLTACQFRGDSESNLIWPLIRQSVEFTHPSPLASQEEKGRVKRRIIQWVDEASKSILVMAYGLNDEGIIRSLLRARQRGVRVRMVLSPEKEYPALKNSGLSLEVRNASGLQHLKAVLIDDRRLISGTGNFTRSGLFHNNNAFLFLNFPEGSGGSIRRKLLSPDKRIPFLKLPGVSMVFSPEGGKLIQAILARGIFRAESGIRLMMYRFTDPVLSALLYHRARQGVPVEGILDGSGYQLPGRSALQEHYYEAGLIPLSLSLDGNENKYQASDGIYHGGHMHQKTAIIDRRVFTGSYNWSMSARNQNREILFILDSPELLRRFSHRFAELQKTSNTIPRSPGGQSLSLPEIRQNSICMEDSEPAYSIYGMGPWFHALEWEKGTSRGDCSASEREAITGDASAGASAGRDYFSRRRTFTLLGGNGQSHSNVSMHSMAPENLPCLQPCLKAPIHRIDLQDGWIRFQEPIGSHGSNISLLALGRERWHTTTLQEQTETFYRLDPLPEQDLLLFFSTEQGPMAACIRYGALDPEIERYLQFLSFAGTNLHCTMAEGG